ncbi:transcriptional regulator [Mycolicibacterium septicum]|nr:transcriptional regulator [Mycolicibacterium septicum]
MGLSTVRREPEAGLREVVHQRVRLGVLAILDRRGPCTFSDLRDALGQSDGGLGRHLSVLEQHGYIATEKVFENRRPRTWVSLSPTGIVALRHEQEVLAELLARASREVGPLQSGHDVDRNAAMTMVFAALLAGEDTDDAQGADEVSLNGTDRSVLLPTAPVLIGRHTTPLASGPVSARFDFPTWYSDFAEHRELRLMLMSHGLRGGWITTWRILPAGHDDSCSDSTADGDHDTANAVVVELRAAADCTSIMSIMGSSTVHLSGVRGARAYLLTTTSEADVPTVAVAWFSVGRYLVSTAISVAAADDAIAALQDLVIDVNRSLSARQS